MSPPPEYVLGTHQAELDRLGFQHRLWADAAHAAWCQAGVRLGHRVLDVGCGPGFASFDLAQLVGRSGAVLGVDASPGFVAATLAGAAARELPHCQARVGDVQSLGALLDGEAPFDLAFARWVLCFVANPEAVVQGVAAALRPGGAWVIHDYFNYTTMTLAPRRPWFSRVVELTAASWRERGGDPDVMGRVPGMLERSGMELERRELHARHAAPGDTTWQWGATWWRNYVPRLVEMGALSPADAEAFFAEFAEAERSTTSFMVMPPVWSFVARKVGP